MADIDETPIDQLTLEQATDLRAMFKRTIKSYDKESMAGLNREERKRRRLILSNFYTRLFQVSKGRKARRTRPKESITLEDPDKAVLARIKEMEQKVKELASRNEELKRENVKTMDLLAKKAGDARGTGVSVPTQESDPLPPSDLSELPEHNVKEWIAQLPAFYESIITDLDTQGEKTLQTNKKLDGLLTVTRKNLRRPKGLDNPSAAGSSSGATSTVTSAATAQWGYSLLK